MEGFDRPTALRDRLNDMSWIRAVGLCGLAFVLLSAFTPLPNVLNRSVATLPRLEPADAIVVLGGGRGPNGRLARALHGITLYRQGLAPLLVFSGPPPDRGPGEAEVRATIARSLGIPSAGLLTLAGAHTTHEEADRTRALLWAKGVRRVLLVTDALHMGRAQRVFYRAGFEVLPAPVEELSSAARGPRGRLELMYRVLGELLARGYYRVAGYL